MEKTFKEWLQKSKITELDVIKCRKMQSVSIAETESAYGITTRSAGGFSDNDYVKVGEPIKQHYAESKEEYYKRVHTVMIVSADLMDAVNGVLADEGSWGPDYFHQKVEHWYSEKMNSLSQNQEQ